MSGTMQSKSEVAAVHPNPQTDKYTISWAQIYGRVARLDKSVRYWGIPRGGQVIAGLTGCAVDKVEECDIIVDDIYDTGQTAKAYEKFGKPIVCLINKEKEGIKHWVVFPWENSLQDDWERDVTRMLQRIGEDPAREGLRDTPKRVVKAWKELTTRPPLDVTCFDANGYNQMIISHGIQYYTFCEHHLIPFFGTVSIGYIPGERIVGLSKLARAVEYFSKGVNTQEYFTENIANYLTEKLAPRGLGVIVKGRHLCQEMRGVRKRGTMTTSSVRGLFDNIAAREEFMNLIREEK